MKCLRPLYKTAGLLTASRLKGIVLAKPKKIQITRRWDGAVICEVEAESVKEAVVKAVSTGANLSGANLSRVVLSRANLSRAVLCGANLSRAVLSRANLSGANLCVLCCMTK